MTLAWLCHCAVAWRQVHGQTTCYFPAGSFPARTDLQGSWLSATLWPRNDCYWQWQRRACLVAQVQLRRHEGVTCLRAGNFLKEERKVHDGPLVRATRFRRQLPKIKGPPVAALLAFFAALQLVLTNHCVSLISKFFARNNCTA